MSARSGTPPSHCCRNHRATPRSATKSRSWFFDDYLATWIGVGAGTIQRGPEFILDYWSAPLHWSDEQVNQWFLDGPAVVGVARAAP